MHFNTRVFQNIDDPFLKSEWVRLEQAADVFPQSTYHWCATWWKHLAGRRKLHVVMVLGEEGKALGIAPLCIERHFGVSVLRSFPIHFGDFYTFILDTGAHEKPVIEAIITYIRSNQQWKWVRLEQVPENSVLARIFTEHGFIPKYVTGCVIADFSGLNWKDYLAKRTKNFRRNVRRKHKKIDLRYSVEFNIVSHWKEFDTKFNQMVLMHEDRWQDDRSPAKGAREIACWRQAIKEQFNNQKIAFYQLSFDGDPAAYRLGFLYKGIYYDWHTGFCKDFEEFSPGFLILSYMIQHFIATGIHAINFMAGEYNWKYDWSWDKRKIDNYMFTSRSRGIASTLLNAYHHKIRDKIKSYYHQAMEYKALRAVSRNAILVWQKITGHS